MIPINMPQVGQDYPTGTIVLWLKKENEAVEKGEVVLQVESEKATFDVEAEQTGVLLKILHEEGSEVEILKPVGYIGQPGEKFEQLTSEKKVEDTQKRQEIPAVQESNQTAASKKETGRINASPSAKRLAREHSIDLAAVKGTGPDGRITKEDVLAAAQKAPLAQPQKLQVQADENDTVIEFDRVRKKIAERLTLSKQTVPHFYLNVDADVTDLLSWRKTFNGQQNSHITVTDIVVKAVALSLAEFDRMNSHVEADKIIIKKDINVGIAVSTDNGLLVPVISNTDKKTLQQISEQSKDNSQKAKQGRLNLDTKGTFTVSTLGMYAIKSYIPIINPPECSILAIGSAEKRPTAVADKVEIRQIMTLTLASDHRAVDGAYATQFLNAIKDKLENIEKIKG